MFSRKSTLKAFDSVNVKWMLTGITLLTLLGTLTFGLVQWEVAGKQDALCSQARQNLKDVEIRARALAAGLSVEAYAKAEEDDVAALVGAIDAAHSESEVDSAIEAHAATIEAKNAAIDAEVDTRGEQAFLEQRLMEQRIPVDVKQELRRAEKAVSISCI